MGQRVGLHDMLASVLDIFAVWQWDEARFDSGEFADVFHNESLRHVYFQPPENVKLSYPCIIYERSNIDSTHADDSLYLLNKRYSVTVIDKDPDSGLPEAILALPKCRFDRHYVSDNLNHDVFTIYY